MLTYTARRLLAVIPAVIGVITLVFLMLRAIPGDPAAFIGGENAGPEALEALRQRLGLSEPLHEQYFNYVLGLVTFDLGTSLHTGIPLTSVIASAFPITFTIAISAIVVGTLIAVPAGLLAAYAKFTKKERTDSAITSTVMVLDNIPGFWLALILMLLLSYNLHLFPVSGAMRWDDPLYMAQRLALPVLVLGIGQVGAIARITRTSVLQTLGEDYIRTARSLGESERTILFRHALPNAALPIITITGLSMGRLIAGTVIVESIFSIPGLGTELIGAITGRDYPVVQGMVLIYALIFVAVNVITDIVYTRVDPRVRLA